ncbi:hypothetical protein BH24ACT15_BH24ACT15_05420 [soil metagenome]
MTRAAFVLALATLTVASFATGAFAQDAFNCDDFTYQEDAQQVYERDTSDPHGLDGPPGPNNDTTGTPGVACEELPSRPASAAPADVDVAEDAEPQGTDETDTRTVVVPSEMADTGPQPPNLPVIALISTAAAAACIGLRRRFAAS